MVGYRKFEAGRGSLLPNSTSPFLRKAHLVRTDDAQTPSLAPSRSAHDSNCPAMPYKLSAALSAHSSDVRRLTRPARPRQCSPFSG